MEGHMEVHGEVVPENVLQSDSELESHVVISQDISENKTKPTVGRPRGRLKSSLERQTNHKSQSKRQKGMKAQGKKVQSKKTIGVGSSFNVSSREHSNVEQAPQLVDNLTQV
ncbi:hypothetical protein SO802_005964 [Lithocarpus litseifolius]|uniref:Uncharacterized protein n=1 Tax=Lithocarpus litseifolius TaxID=425828 RepID=A0AAW2DKB3_9ROSI